MTVLLIKSTVVIENAYESPLFSISEFIGENAELNECIANNFEK